MKPGRIKIIMATSKNRLTIAREARKLPKSQRNDFVIPLKKSKVENAKPYLTRWTKLDIKFGSIKILPKITNLKITPKINIK